MASDVPPEPTPGPAANPFAVPPDGVPQIESTTDERTMALLAHLGGILTGFIVPLIIWLIKKDQSKFVDDQGKEALNFQLNIVGYSLIGVVFGIVTCGIGFLLFIPLFVYVVVIAIIAGMRANAGELYRYPATIRIIK